MKKQVIGLMIVLFLAGFSWAQVTKAPFDLKKSGEELEIMKGILSTTVEFALNPKTEAVARWRYTNVSAFYLAGQGAVFVMPTSTMSIRQDSFNQEIAALSMRIGAAASEMALARTYDQARARLGGGVGGGIPGEKKDSVLSTKDREALRKQIEEAQLKEKKARETAEANRKKFDRDLDAIKAYLVEALANYGDSMTSVKPSEHINLVLTTSGLVDDLASPGGKRARTDIISAEKSWIADYKAGKLTLDGFKQKVLQYSE